MTKLFLSRSGKDSASVRPFEVAHFRPEGPVYPLPAVSTAGCAAHANTMEFISARWAGDPCFSMVRWLTPPARVVSPLQDYQMAYNFRSPAYAVHKASSLSS